MTRQLKIWLALVIYFSVEKAMTATLSEISDIKVANNVNQSIVTIVVNNQPSYTFFSLHNPERIVIDIYQIVPLHRLPVDFNSKNLLIQRIRTSTPVNQLKSLRIVVELTSKLKFITQVAIQQVGGQYNLVFTVTRQPRLSSAAIHSMMLTTTYAPKTLAKKSLLKRPNTRLKSLLQSSKPPVVVAIDAGHGGQDPGATGPTGLHEKNVTIAIARKLKNLLDSDPMFKPVLTRDGNYCISVMGRADVARQNGARVLISIHANAASNRSASGASVWVLSNQQRANQYEKPAELLGCTGSYLLAANRKNDHPYLSQELLDLRFGHSQSVGYDIALKVLSQLKRIGTLHKTRPEHASLGVLRSPDIPSLLVETGFISNTNEEHLLGSSAYQHEIAKAIYFALRAYFIVHKQPLKISPKLPPRLVSAATEADSSHKVEQGETLYSISRQYNVSIKSLRALNNLQKNRVLVGQRLRISLMARIRSNAADLLANICQHQIVLGDNLTYIVIRYAGSIFLLDQPLTIQPALI